MLAIKAMEFEGGLYVRLGGVLEDLASLNRLCRVVTGRHIVLHTRELKRTTSFGLRDFKILMADLESRRNHLVHVELGSALVSQAILIETLLGKNPQILSLMLPYFCASCDAEVEAPLAVTAGVAPIVPAMSCGTCGSSLEFDDLTGRYLGLLQGVTVGPAPPVVRKILQAVSERT